jgi:SAM-dependent methyltransferase
MNRRIWILLIVVISSITTAGCMMQTTVHTNNAAAEVPSGEWHWENFTQEEIDSWSQTHYPSFFTLLYRWGETGKKTLLDVGAGQGHETIIFAEKGYDVSAIDINKFAMDRLAKIAVDKRLPIKTKIGDVRNLPYPDKSFDLVYANQIVNLNGCKAMSEIVAELARVAKDDGQIFFTLNIHVEGSNPLFKKALGAPRKNTCIQGTNKNESVCSVENQYTTVYCGVDQAMLEELLKPYKVKWAFMEFFLNPIDLSYMNGGHYHILIEKK